MFEHVDADDRIAFKVRESLNRIRLAQINVRGLQARDVWPSTAHLLETLFIYVRCEHTGAGFQQPPGQRSIANANLPQPPAEVRFDLPEQIALVARHFGHRRAHGRVASRRSTGIWSGVRHELRSLADVVASRADSAARFCR